MYDTNEPWLGETLDRDVLEQVASSELEEAWRTDTKQVDGKRTYEVHRVSNALNSLGFPRDLIQKVSTLAAIKVSEELNG